MPIYIGSTALNDLFIGTNKVWSVFSGANQVYPNYDWVRRGCLANWEGKNLKSGDTVWTDTSGNNNNGIITSGTVIPGIGWSRPVGIDGLYKVQTANTISIASDFTIEAYGTFTPGGFSYNMVIAMSINYYLGMSSSYPIIQYYAGPYNTVKSFNPGTYKKNIALVVKNSNLYLYGNGVLLATSLNGQVTFASNSNFIIGSGFNGTTQSAVSGTYNVARFYNVALTDAEILQNYEYNHITYQ